MRNRLTILLSLGALALALLPAAHAEKADRNKPMNIEADALRHDELKQTSVFTGRVVMTKGTIVLRGAQLEVRQDPDGFQHGVVTAEPGKRAFFRQKRDTLAGAPDEFVEGEGEVIEYDGRTDIVKLIRRAELRRYREATLADELTGALIVYNNITEIYTVDGRSFRPLPANHVVPACGIHVFAEAGGLVFSGDTTHSEAFVAALNAIPDLRHLIVETSFENELADIAKLSKHHWPDSLAAELKRLAIAPAVWITHLKPGNESAIMNELRAAAPAWRIEALMQGQLIEI